MDYFEELQKLEDDIQMEECSKMLERYYNKLQRKQERKERMLKRVQGVLNMFFSFFNGGRS